MRLGLQRRPETNQQSCDSSIDNPLGYLRGYGCARGSVKNAKVRSVHLASRISSAVYFYFYANAGAGGWERPERTGRSPERGAWYRRKAYRS